MAPNHIGTWIAMEKMDYEDRNHMHKYLDVDAMQPGLEVGENPYDRKAAQEWPDANNKVWGVEREEDHGKGDGDLGDYQSKQSLHYASESGYYNASESGDLKPIWRKEETVAPEVIDAIPAQRRFAAPAGAAAAAKKEEGRRIGGLRVGIFWGLVVLLCCIIAGGVGGGIGVGLASSKAACSSGLTNNTSANSTASKTNTASSTPSATSTSNLPPNVSPAPSFSCGTSSAFSANGSTLTPLDSTGAPIPLNSTSQTFSILCNTNYPSGATYQNPGVHDIMKIWTTDLNHCVSVCAEYNSGLEALYKSGVGGGGNGTVGYCRAVSLILKQGEFCYLKSATGRNDTAPGMGAEIVSAVLLGIK